MLCNDDVIPLEKIDFQNTDYQITTEENTDSLCFSIKKIGLIQRPLLIRGEKKYIVLCGFRRINALKRLNESRIKAQIIEAREAELEKIQVAITDNIFQRQLNLIEQSRALSLLRNLNYDDKQLIQEASNLGLPGNLSVIEKILQLCRLPDEIQQYIISNSISLPIAIELARLDADTSVTIARLFFSLGFGLNKQREMLTFLREIAKREDTTIASLLNEFALRKIIDDDQAEKPLKARHVRTYLKKRRFPRLSEAEKAYQEAVKKLPFDNGMKLMPPIHFEGNSYTLSIDFKNLDELKMRRAILDRVINHSALKTILA